MNRSEMLIPWIALNIVPEKKQLYFKKVANDQPCILVQKSFGDGNAEESDNTLPETNMAFDWLSKLRFKGNGTKISKTKLFLSKAMNILDLPKAMLVLGEANLSSIENLSHFNGSNLLSRFFQHHNFLYFSLHSSLILFLRTLQWSQSFLLVFRHLLTFVYLTSAMCVDTCTTTSSNGSSLDGTWNVIGTSCMDSTGGLGLCWIHGCRDERSCQGFCTKPIMGFSRTSNIFLASPPSLVWIWKSFLFTHRLPVFHSLPVFLFEHIPGAIWRPTMWWVWRSAYFSFVF